MTTCPADTGIDALPDHHEPDPEGRLILGSFPLARRFPAQPRRRPRRPAAVQLTLDLNLEDER